jgi:hypothetical protein
MRVLLLLIALTCGIHPYAQNPGGQRSDGSDGRGVADRGTWIGGIGFQAGVYKNIIRQNVFGLTDTETDSVAATFFPVSVEYCILNQFSAGLRFRGGRYIDDEDYSANTVNGLDILLSYHILRKQNNDLFVQLAAGGAWLSIRNSRDDVTGTWRGSHAALTVGYRHYFGRRIGVHVTLSRPGYEFLQESLDVAGIVVDPEDARWDMSLSGVEFGFGLSARF